MPQKPSISTPAELIQRFKGLFDQKDSIRRPSGATTSESNILDVSTGDADRRHGRVMESLTDGEAIQIIYPIYWADGSITVVNQTDGTMSFDDFTYATSGDGNLAGKIVDPAFPGPMPNIPTFLPLFQAKNASTIPDLTSYMRALSEARIFAFGSDDIIWPNQIWALEVFLKTDGDPVSTGQFIRSKLAFDALKGNAAYGLRPTLSQGPVSPATPGTDIPDDFYYVDYLVQAALVINHLDIIINRYNTKVITSYVKTNPIQNATTILNYTAADFFNETPDFEDYQEVAGHLAAAINQNPIRFNAGAASPTFGSNRVTLRGNSGISNDRSCVQTEYQNTTSYDEERRQISSAATCSLSTGSPIDLGEYFGVVWFQNSSSTPGGGGMVRSMNKIGNLALDLSAYDSTATGQLYMKLKKGMGGFPNFDFGQDPRPVNAAEGAFGLWGNANVTPGSVWISPTVTEADQYPSMIAFPDPDLGVSGCNGAGWAHEDNRVILVRNPRYRAKSPYAFGGSGTVITPDEVFTKSANQIISGSTDIQWDMVKLTVDGAADRSYPQTQTGLPVPFAASSVIDYNSDAPGFSQARFGTAYYRPTILLILDLRTYLDTGTPSSYNLLFKINGTTVKSFTSVPLGINKFVFAFSVYGVGQFGEPRPPQNNPLDSYNGWGSPAVSFQITPDTGTIRLDSTSTLTDYVVNYPFG